MRAFICVHSYVCIRMCAKSSVCGCVYIQRWPCSLPQLLFHFWLLDFLDTAGINGVTSCHIYHNDVIRNSQSIITYVLNDWSNTELTYIPSTMPHNAHHATHYTTHHTTNTTFHTQHYKTHHTVPDLLAVALAVLLDWSPILFVIVYGSLLLFWIMFYQWVPFTFLST